MSNLVTLGALQNWDLPGLDWPIVGNYCEVSSFVDYVQVSGSSPYQVYNIGFAEFEAVEWSIQEAQDLDDGNYDDAEIDALEVAEWDAEAVDWWLSTKLAQDSPDPINLLFGSYSHSDLHTPAVWKQVVSDCFLP